MTLNVSIGGTTTVNLTETGAVALETVQVVGSRVVNRDDARTLAMGAGAEELLTFGLDVPQHRHEWGLDEARRHLRRGPVELMPVSEIGVSITIRPRRIAAQASGSFSASR